MEKDKITIVILGDGGAGKSCITMRLLRSKWVDEYDPTIEDSYTTNRTVDGQSHRLDIIDTAGQEEYREMLGSLFNADTPIDAYLLVYDITSRTSLETLAIFDELIEKNLESGAGPKGGTLAVKVVAGNKSDLSESRAVSSSEGLAWAKAHGCGFMETSAKVMVNIEETFEIIVRQVVRNRFEAANGGGSGKKGGTSSGITAGSTGVTGGVATTNTGATGVTGVAGTKPGDKTGTGFAPMLGSRASGAGSSKRGLGNSNSISDGNSNNMNNNVNNNNGNGGQNYIAANNNFQQGSNTKRANEKGSQLGGPAQRHGRSSEEKKRGCCVIG